MDADRVRLDADEWNEDIDRLVSDHYGDQRHDRDWLRAFGEGLIRAANRPDSTDDENDHAERVGDAIRP